MFLRITVGSDEPVTLHEADDFGRFHVEVVGMDAIQLRTTVEQHHLGRVADGDHVDVRVAALSTLAGPRGPEWDTQFASMLSYAGSKGWMPDTEHVRAHCEWVG